MNRKDLQRLSRIRLKEARVLLDNKCYDGTYYLSGYAVECALKACIAKQVGRHEFPDKRTVLDSYSHDLEDLLRVAGLKADMDRDVQTDPQLGTSWTVVQEWTEASRYSLNSRSLARRLYRAIVNRDHGVMRWIRQH